MSFFESVGIALFLMLVVFSVLFILYLLIKLSSAVLEKIARRAGNEPSKKS